MKLWTRALPIALAIAGAATLASAPVAVAVGWEREIAVADSGRLRVELDFGSVSVTAHDEPTARLIASVHGLGASEYRFALARDGDELRLTGRAPAWLALMVGSPEVAVEIRIPSGYAVDVATDSGDVLVASVSGATVRTRAGAVAVRDIRGAVDITTRDGGAVDIDGVTGEVVADAQGAPIHARFDRAPSGWLRASGGAVDIALRAGVGTQIDARAPGGCVFIDNRVHAGCGEASGPVVLPINGGGPLLQVRARRGDILIAQLD